MNLYRLQTKRPRQTPTPDNPSDVPPATSRSDTQPAEQRDALGNAEFAAVVTSPKGTWSGRLFMALHWRLFFFGIGAAGMLFLFADRVALVLSALGHILRPTGLPIGQ